MTLVLHIQEMESPIGTLTLCRTDRGLCQIEFGCWDEHRDRLAAWASKWIGSVRWTSGDSSCKEVQEQLEAYFAGALTKFDAALDLFGTPFQKRVWEALCGIPYAETRSYKQIAEAIGSPQAMRAVGGANNKNPVPLIVPCHRVIGASGGMVGYGGGLSIKTFLLELERSNRVPVEQGSLVKSEA